MLFECIPLWLWQRCQIARRVHRHSETFRAEKVTYAFRPPNDHRRLWIGCHPGQNFVPFAGTNGHLSTRRGSAVCIFESVLHFVGSLTECEFPQRRQGRFPKEVLESLLGFLVSV